MRLTKSFSERSKTRWIVFGLAAASVVLHGQEEPESEVITAESLEARSQRLFETREAIAKEQAAWAEQKPLFENLIALREKEIAEIDEFTETARERVEEVTQQRRALEDEEAARKAWRSDFAGEVSSLERSMREMVPLLPTPVKEKVGASITRLESTDVEELPLQERFRDILTVLSAARDFDSKLTIDSEIREFAGKRYQIDILYLGLDQAWFVDESGEVAGIGSPTPTGWSWKEDRSIASAVRAAIAVNRREAPPAMVSLPFVGKPAPSAAAE